MPWCRLNACKTQCIRWVYSIPKYSWLQIPLFLHYFINHLPSQNLLNACYPRGLEASRARKWSKRPYDGLTTLQLAADLPQTSRSPYCSSVVNSSKNQPFSLPEPPQASQSLPPRALWDPRLNGWKTQYIRWVCSIPRHQSWYPDVASMHVKRNTYVQNT